jgi:hypothetical protein
MKPALLLTTLLLISAIGSSQILCDTSNQLIYTFLEHPPQPTLTNAELELNLNNSIDQTSLDKYNADYLYVTFFINCNGEDFNYKLAKLSDGLTKMDTTSDFQKSFLFDFQSIASWTPGRFTFYEKGKPVDRPVDFQGRYTIRVDGNRLHILNEKEKKKHFKNKQKK